MEKVLIHINAVPHVTQLAKNYKGKGKGKAVPLQALTGLESSRGLRLPAFKTIGT
jgi:hypothetical protein